MSSQPSSSQPSRIPRRIVLLLVAAALVAHGVSFGLSPQDDAFITFRYARNLVEGHGAVYNPGERVEGYTNFLWMAAMAAAVASGVDPLAASRTLGLLCALGLLLLLARERNDRRSAGMPSWTGVGAGALLAASGSFAAEAVQGLETVLFALLATAIVLVTEREGERGGRGVLPGLLGAAAALTRPEGSLVLAGAALHRLLPAPLGPGRGRWGKDRLVPALTSAGICLSVTLVHRLAAWSYYGAPLPNTFYNKVGGGWDAVARGAAYAGEFALSALPLLVMAVIGLVTLRASRRTLRAGFVAAWIVYVIGVGGDFKATFRFFVAILPMLCLLAAGGAAYLASQIERPLARRLFAGSLVTAVAVLIAALSFDARQFSAMRRERYALDRLAGTWFGENFPPGTLMATPNAGVVPYYSRLPTLDILGLTDHHIARVAMPGMGQGVAGHERSDAAYVLSREPELIVFRHSRVTGAPIPVAEAGRRVQFLAELQLWQNPKLLREYEWVSVPLAGHSLNFFRRRWEAAGSPPPSPPR